MNATVDRKAGRDGVQRARSPEARIRRLRNRARRRWERWREALQARIGRDREEVRRRIEEIRESLDATDPSGQVIKFIATFEGFCATAYRFPGETYLTIGHGHYGPDVKPGETITREEALLLLRSDTASASAAVRDAVTVRLEQHEFDALVSFTFNCGAGALRSSTLLRKLNAGDRAGAAAEFGRWVNGATGSLPGLVRRRAEERQMFLHGDYEID